jgi:hypothetical protein
MATIRMLALEEAKRYILTAAFLVVQTAQAHDLAEMFIRHPVPILLIPQDKLTPPH